MNTKKKILLLSFKIVITLLVIYAINRGISFSEVQSIQHFFTVFHVSIALGISFLSIFLQILRWETVLRFYGFIHTSQVVIKSVFVGFFLGLITPGRAGELFRGLSLARHNKIHAVKAALVERIFASMAVLFCTVCVVLFERFSLKVKPTELSNLLLVLVSVLSLLLILYYRYGHLFQTLFLHKYKTVGRLLREIPLLPGTLLKPCFWYSVVTQACLITQTMVLFHMFGWSFSVGMATSLYQAYTATLFLPISIGNLGIREAAFFSFLSNSIVQTPTSVLNLKLSCLGVSMIIFSMNLALPALIGCLWFCLNSSKSLD